MLGTEKRVVDVDKEDKMKKLAAVTVSDFVSYMF